VRLESVSFAYSSDRPVLRGSTSSDLLSSAAESPLVLQRRVRSDRIPIPFRDQDSGRQVEVHVPFVLSPYVIDGAAASVAVRHMGPGVPDGDVVISASRGAYQSTALLAPAPLERGPLGRLRSSADGWSDAARRGADGRAPTIDG
jgi:hypothetical protein